MQFKLKNKNSGLNFKTQVLTSAYITIAAFSQNATEIALSNLLEQTVGYSLKNCCRLLVKNATISQKHKAELTITWLDPKLDALAQLITFGDGYIMGSRILIKAFGYLDEGEVFPSLGTIYFVMY